jgi:hypothetical protein
MNNADTSDIHRLLDEAFLGIVMTPDLQDFKEELRGNLASRSAELQQKGMDAAAASRAALAEVGDVAELIAGVEADGPLPAQSGSPAARLHRVQPNQWFVVRASIYSALILASALHTVFDVVDRPLQTQPYLIVIGVLLVALVADSLSQETARHYAMPLPRGIRWGVASGLLGTGVGYGVLFGWHTGSTGLLIASIALVLLAMIAFITLGATQTNRLKPWALAEARAYETEDRFSNDPVAAARFGMYTVIIWIVAIAVFIGLSIAVGFAWSWLAIVAGLVVFFLVLARMLFAPEHHTR